MANKNLLWNVRKLMQISNLNKKTGLALTVGTLFRKHSVNYVNVNRISVQKSGLSASLQTREQKYCSKNLLKKEFSLMLMRNETFHLHYLLSYKDDLNRWDSFLILLFTFIPSISWFEHKDLILSLLLKCFCRKTKASYVMETIQISSLNFLS